MDCSSRTLTALDDDVKKTLLFSDVHLGVTPATQSAYRAFLSFLREIDPVHVERMICLGDLFDFWFEYRHVVFSGYFDVLRAFADLNDAGVELHLVCGNHDFWAGRFLREAVGFTLHYDAVRMDFGGREALLLHGDGLNPRDRGYRCFKRFARNGLAVKLFRWVHPDAAMTLARSMSRHSRALSSAENPADGREAGVVRAHAHQLLRDGVAPIVICGHSHVPAVETTPAAEGMGLYINPGDWPRHRSYVEWDGREFKLLQYCSTD